MKELKPITLGKISISGEENLTVEITASASYHINTHSSELHEIVYTAINNISNHIRSEQLVLSPVEIKRVENERKGILSLFDDAIFVKTIPNEYGAMWYNKHIPWYLITTKIGTFKIGSRKHVYHIEWTDTVGTKTSEELFSDEDVTKGKKMIHAWTLEKAKEYVSKIMSTADRSCLITN